MATAEYSSSSQWKGTTESLWAIIPHLKTRKHWTQILLSIKSRTLKFENESNDYRWCLHFTSYNEPTINRNNFTSEC